MNIQEESSDGWWGRLIGLALQLRVVVLVLAGLLMVGSLVVAPFEQRALPLPRDPVPVDAIPDIGENQQIVFTRWEGRSPRDIEDQITYPLTTALLGMPGVKTIRSASMLGFSTVYVIFEDGVEFYWSRSRVLEKLASLGPELLPAGVTPTLGPDATALGQVFWYTLEGRSAQGEVLGGWSQHELRSVQDWTVRYALQGVPGVSEVASVGGAVQEYQIDLDPEAMRAHGVTLGQLASAVRGSNLDTGARTLEINQVEYVIRGVGLIKGVEDLEQTVVAQRELTPIRVRDVAKVALGPAARRGALDNAGAEAVGGVVVARFGENPRAVIQRVKERLEELAPSLPKRTLADGQISQVQVVPFYDRAALIEETLGTLTEALWQQLLITVLVVVLLLRRLRAVVVISATLPMAVLTSFLAMKWFGVGANVMSLAGIAIAIGTMVDIGIVLTEAITERLDALRDDEDRAAAIRAASAEVAPAVLTSVATTVVGFLPVFALTEAEGKLFVPLAWTKSFALLGALGFGVLVLPPLASALLWPRARAAGEGTSWRRRLRTALGPAHWRQGLLVVLGVALLGWSPWAGGLSLLIGGAGLCRPLLTESRQHLIERVEVGVATLGGLWLLSEAWAPLGAGAGALANLALASALVLGLMSTFWIFLRFYEPLLRFALAHKGLFLLAPGALLLAGLLSWQGAARTLGWLPGGAPAALERAFPGLGREFMPPFDEGSFLYMPTAMPHASLGEAQALLEELDASIKEIPEVDQVVGKIGRVESALDPAPVSMMEVVVTYHPEYEERADGSRARRWRPHIRAPADIWEEISAAGAMPGLTGAPLLMPIQTRIVMLQTGMRAAMGVKVTGPDLERIEAGGLALEAALREAPSVRPETVFAERVVGKPYLEIEIDREAIGRFGLTVAQVQEVIQLGIGGAALTRTIEGRERYAVRLRFQREERDSVEALRRLPVDTPGGAVVTLEQLAELRYVRGPQMIKSEGTFPIAFVTFDRRAGISEAEAVEQAERFLQERVARGELTLPEGVSYRFAGTYENQLRSDARLRLLVPVALALIFVLLYVQFRRVGATLMVFSGVAVAMSGGFVLLWLYGQPWFLDFTLFGVSARALFQVGPTQLSVAVWVGFLALFGVATDDGVVMATRLDQSFQGARPRDALEVRALVVEAGLRRVRPCLMTTATTILALLPVLTSQGRGADVMLPMALPSLGGMGFELLTLFVVPVLYSAVEEARCAWRARREAAR